MSLYDAVKAAAPANIEQFCRSNLPSGKRAGDWWLVRCPWRKDSNPSLGISMTTGYWRDFARGDSGSVIDLYCRLKSVEHREAVAELARMFGVKNGS